MSEEDYSQQASYDATFEVGDRVRMVGLRAAAKYNGVTGTVSGLDGAERYLVKLDPGKIELRVQPNNMRKIDANTSPREVPAGLPRALNVGSPFVPPAAPGVNGITDFTPRPAPPHPTPSSNFPRSNPPQQPVFSPSVATPAPPDLSRGSPALPQQPQFEDTPAPPAIPSVPSPAAPDYASDPNYIVRPPPPIQRAHRKDDEDFSDTPRAGIHAILAEVKAPNGERHILIEDMLEGGQLERKGVRKMDRVLEVQGRPASSMSLRQIQGMISGNDGSNVDIVVQHPATQTGPSPPFAIKVTRTYSQTADALVMFHEELEALVQAPLEQAAASNKPPPRLPPHLAKARGKLHADILQLKASQADLLAQHGTLRLRLDQAARDNNHLNQDLRKAEEEARALKKDKDAEKFVQARMARDFDEQLRQMKTGGEESSGAQGCLASLRLRADANIFDTSDPAAASLPHLAQEQQKQARRKLEEEVAAAIDTDQERISAIGMRPDLRVVDLIIYPPSERSSDFRSALELAQEILNQANKPNSALRRCAVTTDIEGVEVKAGQGWVSYLRAKNAFLEDQQSALRQELRAKDYFVQNAKREIAAADEKTEAMRKEKEALAKQLEAAREKTTWLQREQAATLQQLEKIKRELETLREEVYNDNVLQETKRRMEAAEDAQEALVRDLAELRADSEEKQAAADKAHAQAVRVRDEATARAEHLAKTVQELKDEAATQKRHHESRQSMLDLEASRREHAEKVRDELQEAVRTEQDALFALKVEHEKTKASLREHASRIQTMASREANLKEANRGLEHQIEEVRKRNAAQVNGVPHAEVQQMLAEHNTLLAAKQARVDDLEQRILEVDTAMADLNRELFEAPLTMEEKSKFEIKAHQHARHHAALSEQLDWRTAEVVSLRQQIRSFLSNSGSATLENQKVISEQHRTLTIQQRELEQTKAALANAQGELEELTKERQAVLEGLLDVMLREEKRSKDPQQWLHRDAGERYKRNEQQMKMMVETYEQEVTRLSRRVVQLEAPVLQNWDDRIASALLNTNHLHDQDEVADTGTMDPEGWSNKMPSLADRTPPPSAKAPARAASGASDAVPGSARQRRGSVMVPVGGKVGEVIEVEIMRGRGTSSSATADAEGNVGLGVFLACPCVVMAVKDGSPAQRSGEIRPGDFLQKINGESTKGKDGTELSKSLTGPPGTAVRLSLFRMFDGNADSAPLNKLMGEE